MGAQLDFGYPWWLSYGHLILFGVLLAAFLTGWVRRWNRWPMLLLGVAGLWAVSGFLIARFVLNANGRGSLPTANFLSSGEGRVLDIGAGTGRSSIMVLGERPRAKVVAFDLFGRSFEQHFGPGAKPEERLAANLRAVGFEDRAEIRAGDMRKLPFPDVSFDGVISSYAIDHLNREGVGQALSEALRVLKPGGDFLLMLIGKDPWVQFAFGPLLAHGGLRGAEWWRGRLEESGFQIVEQGMRPATLYFVARRRD